MLGTDSLQSASVLESADSKTSLGLEDMKFGLAFWGFYGKPGINPQ
jgi:hypothetical protein